MTFDPNSLSGLTRLPEGVALSDGTLAHQCSLVNIPPITPKRGLSGWCLKMPSGDAVVTSAGFTAWFLSRAKALAAADEVTFDAENGWLVYDA